MVNASPDRDGRRSPRSQCAYHQQRRKRREAETHRHRAHARHSAEHSAHSDAAETSDGTRSAPRSSLSHRLDARHDTVLQYPDVRLAGLGALISQQCRGRRAARRCPRDFRFSALSTGMSIALESPANCAVAVAAAGRECVGNRCCGNLDRARPRAGRLRRVSMSTDSNFASALSLHRERSAAAASSPLSPRHADALRAHEDQFRLYAARRSAGAEVRKAARALVALPRGGRHDRHEDREPADALGWLRAISVVPAHVSVARRRRRARARVRGARRRGALDRKGAVAEPRDRRAHDRVARRDRRRRRREAGADDRAAQRRRPDVGIRLQMALSPLRFARGRAGPPRRRRRGGSFLAVDVWRGGGALWHRSVQRFALGRRRLAQQAGARHQLGGERGRGRLLHRAAVAAAHALGDAGAHTELRRDAGAARRRRLGAEPPRDLSCVWRGPPRVGVVVGGGVRGGQHDGVRRLVARQAAPA